MVKDSLQKYMEEEIANKYLRQRKAMAELDKFSSKRDAAGGRVWTIGDMQRYFNRKKRR
jgi:hypothetical protein